MNPVEMNASYLAYALSEQNHAETLRPMIFEKIHQFMRDQFAQAGLDEPLYGFEMMASIYEEHLWENRTTKRSYADHTTLAARIEEAARQRMSGE